MAFNKNIILIALCVILMTVAVMGSSFEAKFLADHLPHSTSSAPITSIAQFTLNDIDLAKGLTLTPTRLETSPTGTDLWSFTSPAMYGKKSFGVEILRGHFIFCWDVNTLQVVATISTTSSGLEINASAYSAYTTLSTETKKNKYVIQCPVAVNTASLPVDTNLAATGYDLTDTAFAAPINGDLALPTNGVTQPLMDFNSLSVKQKLDDAQSTAEFSFEFTTDMEGVYKLQLNNGAFPRAIDNNKAGKVANFYCSQGSNKEFARMIYPTPSTLSVCDPSGSNSDEAVCNILIAVPQSTSKDAIKCTVIYSQLFPMQVNSERVSATISLGSSRVTRTVDFKYAPASIQASVYSKKQGEYLFQLLSSPLRSSSTQINVNSTIAFHFSKNVDITTFSINSYEYRGYEGCYGFYSTLIIDQKHNIIRLEDVDTASIPELLCRFSFSGTDAFKFDTKVNDVAHIKVTIDNKSLRSGSTGGDDLPLYSPGLGENNNLVWTEATQVASTDNKSVTITDVFSFKDNYQQSLATLRHPKLIVAITGDQTFTYENYATQVTCQATTPFATFYEELKLKFDEKTLTWSVDLTHLKAVEAFQILIKCSRTVNTLHLYGVDITPISNLAISIIDPVDKARFSYFAGPVSGQAVKRVQTATQTGAYPTDKAVAVATLATMFHFPDISSADSFNKYYSSVSPVVNGILSGFDDNKGWTFNTVTGFVGMSMMSSHYASIQEANEMFQHATNNGKSVNTFDFTGLDNVATVFDMADDIVNNDASLIELMTGPVAKVPTLEYSNLPQVNSYNYLIGSYMYDVMQYVVATPPAGVTTLPSVSISDDDLAPTYGTTKWGEEIVLCPAVNPPATAVVALPFTGCGYATRIITNSDITMGATFPTGTGTDEEKWDDFVDTVVNSKIVSCGAVGAKCSMNADCHTGICKANVCTELPKVLPPYVHVATFATKAFDDQFYNSSTSITMYGAMMMIVVALFF